MNDYGTLIDPATVCFERLLPGPLERVWSYLTVSEKRAKWLAEGEMDLRVGGAVKLNFKNSELSPEYVEAPAEHQETECGGSKHDCRITALEIPRLLTMSWGEGEGASEVSFELSEKGGQVLLTVVHRQIPNRNQRVSVSGGWHTHLDVLRDVLNEKVPAPFWSSWKRLNEHYEKQA